MAGQTSTFVVVLLLFFATGEISAKKGIVKGGIYKIESLSDHSALTTTWNGYPREVTTDEWKETALQEWRVRSTINLGETVYILRNEFVKDNEVNKVALVGTSGKNGKEELAIAEWTLTSIEGQEHAFTIQRNKGCLQNNGMGQRISIVPCVPAATNQQWILEFLFDKHE